MDLPQKCTGCMACYNSCKYNAIEIVQNYKGFYIPKINSKICKQCGICKINCPEINAIKANRWKECFAAWSKNELIRKSSTSGGVFYEIAASILKDSGIIYGVLFDYKENKVYHGSIDKLEDLKLMQGSKYVQSYVGDIFSNVKKNLENNKTVLFSGVACQIAGLKKYLGKDFSNLITVDVLCHGVPSPKIFNDYLVEKNIKNINKINFRYKKPSWTVFSMNIEYDNKKYNMNTNKDEYLRLFLSDYITNDICSECKYIGENRVSDITLADFWGYISENKKYRNTEKGISLVLLNSEVGKNIFANIKDNICFIEKDFIEAKTGNRCLTKPYEKNKEYIDFWNDYKEFGYVYCKEKYYKQKKMPIKRKLSLFINDNAYILPKPIRKTIYKLKHKKKGV